MGGLRRHIIPWSKAIAAQALAFALLLLIGPNLPVGAFGLVLVDAALAALIGRLLGLAVWWMPIQALVPLAVVYGSLVPLWVYPLAFVLSALVFWNGASEQVPFYMTNRKTWAALDRLVAERGGKRFVDLGSGMGGIVIYLAGRRADLAAVGVENAPLLVVASKLWAALSGRRNAQIRYGSIWDEDLGAYDVVYCFLSPAPMARLHAKAKTEMKAGALLVSNSFVIPDRAPDRTIEVEDARRTQLHLYKM